MEALVELLVSKYGVPPDEAEAYATDIIAASRGTSTRGLSPDGHGAALQEEALGNVASTEQERIVDLLNMAEIANRPGDKPQAYTDRLAQSAANTRNNAARSLAERQREGDAQKRGAEINDAVVGRTLDNVAGGELQRIANMLEYKDGIQSLGGGAYSTEYEQPRDFKQPLVEHPSTVIPVRKPQAQPQAPQPIQDPYVERLVRATRARKALLGE